MRQRVYVMFLAAIVLSLVLCFGCQKQAVGSDKPQTDSNAVRTEQPVINGGRAAILPQAQAVQTETTADANGPTFTLEKNVVDLGNVAPKSVNPCEFKFTNTGKALLVIKQVETTCGCTVIELEKKEYLPGEGGTLKVQYTAGSVGAKATKYIYVHTNDSKKQKTELVIHSQVAPKIEYTPDKLNLNMKMENAGCLPITLKSTDNKPFAITAFKSTANCMTLDFDPNKKDTQFTLTPKIDKAILENNLTGDVQITLTHPDCNSVLLIYDTLSAYKITPSSLIVSNSEPNNAVTRGVWVINNYNEKFDIVSITSSTGIIKVVEDENLGDKHKLMLKITPPPIEGTKRNFKDTLKIQIKDGKTLTLNLNGFYKRKTN